MVEQDGEVSFKCLYSGIKTYGEYNSEKIAQIGRTENINP